MFSSNAYCVTVSPGTRANAIWALPGLVPLSSCLMRTGYAATHGAGDDTTALGFQERTLVSLGWLTRRVRPFPLWLLSQRIR